MSRTKRRTKRKIPSWVTKDYKKIDDHWKLVPIRGKAFDIAINKYQADTKSGMNTAPSWFVKIFFTKKDRAQERQELKRILSCVDYDDYSFKPYKHGAMWLWY